MKKTVFLPIPIHSFFYARFIHTGLYLNHSGDPLALAGPDHGFAEEFRSGIAGQTANIDWR